MRILHIVHQYPPEHIGGTELYCQTLAQQQSKNGHAVAIFVPTSRQETSKQEQFDSKIVLYKPFVGKRAASKIFRSTFSHNTLDQAFVGALEEFRPDLVHIQHLQGLPASIIDRISDAGLPFVATLHDYWFVCANSQLLTNYDQTICAGPDRFLNCARCALFRLGSPSPRLLSPPVAPLMAMRNRLLRSLLERSARLIAPTTFVRRIYEGFQVPKDKMVVIPHGIAVPGDNDPVEDRSSESFFRLPGVFFGMRYVL